MINIFVLKEGMNKIRSQFEVGHFDKLREICSFGNSKYYLLKSLGRRNISVEVLLSMQMKIPKYPLFNFPGVWKKGEDGVCGGYCWLLDKSALDGSSEGWIIAHSASCYLRPT